jgi:D-alanyl-D-alanine dipeptidase
MECIQEYECNESLQKLSGVHNQCLLVIRNKRSKAGGLYVRKRVARMLENAAKGLPPGFRLVVLDGYREYREQRTVFQQQVRALRKKHPSWSIQKTHQQASWYVADPTSFCPHVTGGAVDVTLSKEGKRLRMGRCVLGREYGVSAAEKSNRRILARCMRKAGFVNYPLEWWHWSYGDRYWAAVSGRRKTRYGVIKRRASG